MPSRHQESARVSTNQQQESARIITNLVVQQLSVQVLHAAAGVEAASNGSGHVQAARAVLTQQARQRRQ